MDISYIKEFVVLADCMSFSSASNILFISQSSLSKHIKSLEKELGVSLFDRTTRSIQLTPSGNDFLGYAREIADLYDKACISIDDLKHKSNKSLIIAAMQNPEYYDLAKYMVSFKAAHPDISFQIVEADEFSLYEMFQNKLVNVFPTFELFREEPEDYRFMPIVESRIYAILNEEHPHAGDKVITLKDLSSERLLLPTRNSTLSRLIQRAFKRAGIKPHIAYEGSSSGSVELVKAGMGVSLHAEEFTRVVANDPNIVCIPVEPDIDFVYGVAYREPSAMPHAEQIYLSHLKQFELRK